VNRWYEVDADGAHVRLMLTGTAPDVDSIRYVLPAAARAVQVTGEGLAVSRREQVVTARPRGTNVHLDVTYVL
jgi:hypothetical protein